MINNVLGRVVHEDAARVEATVLDLLQRFGDNPERKDRLRKARSGVISILWITYQRLDARNVLTSWIEHPGIYHTELTEVVGTMRGAFVSGLDGTERDGDAGLRTRAMALVEQVVDAASLGLAMHFSQLNRSESEIAEARKCAQLLDAACRQLYFSVGASGRNDGEPKHLTDDGIAKFYAEAAPILTRIGDFATPHTVYYLLQLLEFLLPFNPEQTFDLAVHALRSGGSLSGYEYESMGADLLVKLVGIFLLTMSQFGG
jgi:hypothetical protein